MFQAILTAIMLNPSASASMLLHMWFHAEREESAGEGVLLILCRYLSEHFLIGYELVSLSPSSFTLVCLFISAGIPSGAVLKILKASAARQRTPIKTVEGHRLKVMTGMLIV